MLLGCCHCGEEVPPSDPSESIPSSESSSGIRYFQHSTCAACISKLYPLLLRLDIPSFGTPPGGSCSEYNGAFYIPGISGSTGYLSSENVININTGLTTTMTSGPNPAHRFTISYVCSRQIPRGTIQDVQLSIRWSLTASSSAAGLASIVYEYIEPGSAVSWDCLKPITLARVGATSLTGPCGTTSKSQWPATVTVTPL